MALKAAAGSSMLLVENIWKKAAKLGLSEASLREIDAIRSHPVYRASLRSQKFASSSKYLVANLGLDLAFSQLPWVFNLVRQRKYLTKISVENLSYQLGQLENSQLKVELGIERTEALSRLQQVVSRIRRSRFPRAILSASFGIARVVAWGLLTISLSVRPATSLAQALSPRVRSVDSFMNVAAQLAREHLPNGEASTAVIFYSGRHFAVDDLRRNEEAAGAIARSVESVPVESIEDFQAKLEAHENAEIFVFKFHGAPGRIQIGSKVYSAQRFEDLIPHFKPSGPNIWIFDSCQLGSCLEGEPSLAEWIHENWNSGEGLTVASSDILLYEDRQRVEANEFVFEIYTFARSGADAVFGFDVLRSLGFALRGGQISKGMLVFDGSLQFQREVEAGLPPYAEDLIRLLQGN